ncbi:MAG TPA: helix-turn-helix domain-containing protein [Candidatus Doudnabacteria bacterium]|nr:helix-turn-helix domain-containing protein [Candidatus Doudnabacteria bacterium]
MTENAQISYLQTLSQAGLTPDQAVIYEVLLKNGPLPAGKIHQKTPFKRGLVYKLLNQLEEMGIVAKQHRQGKVAIFEPAHPLKLKELAEKKEEQAKLAQGALSGILDQMTSEFNLVVGKPGVQFYEGLDGIKKVAFDNLSSTEPILAYVDMSTITNDFSDINDEYVKVRKRLNIQKLNLINQTPENLAILKNYNRNITDIRIIPNSQEMHFSSMMQIYNDKISYITLDKTHMLGIIIQDQAIAELHRQLYLNMWDKSLPLDDFPPTDPETTQQP